MTANCRSSCSTRILTTRNTRRRHGGNVGQARASRGAGVRRQQRHQPLAIRGWTAGATATGRGEKGGCDYRGDNGGAGHPRRRNRPHVGKLPKDHLFDSRVARRQRHRAPPLGLSPGSPLCRHAHPRCRLHGYRTLHLQRRAATEKESGFPTKRCPAKRPSGLISTTVDPRNLQEPAPRPASG